MSVFIGFTGTALLVWGSFRYNVWVGVAVVGFLLMSLAETLGEIERYRIDERAATMGRHPTATPSGEVNKDDIR